MVRFVQQFRFDKKPGTTAKHCNGKRPWLVRVRNKVLEYAYNVCYVRYVLNKVRSSATSRIAVAANDYWWWNDGRWWFWDRGHWWGDFDGEFWRQQAPWIKHPRSWNTCTVTLRWCKSFCYLPGQQANIWLLTCLANVLQCADMHNVCWGHVVMSQKCVI